MKLVAIELIDSFGSTLDVRTVTFEQSDEGAKLIEAAMLTFAQQLILNPGHRLRVSEYQG